MTQQKVTGTDIGVDAGQLSDQLNVPARQVEQAVRLLEDGRTIPFIARYRKEVTGGLDERQLRTIEDAVAQAAKLQDRRVAVLRSLEAKDVPADVLQAIRSATDLAELEQLCQPWRSRRKTRADRAREQGLGPLAGLLKNQRSTGSPDQILKPYIRPDRDVPDAAAALSGACDIVAEEWAADVKLRQWMLDRTGRARIESRVKRGKQDSQSPFADYFEHSEPTSRSAAHRLLAMFRGAREGVLNVSIRFDDDWILPKLERRLIRNPQFPFVRQLRETVKDCYRRLLRPATQSVVLQRLRERAERESIDVFAANLREMLMAAPAGPRPVIGIDPGYRTGCKLAVLDETGRFVTSHTIFPTPPRNDTEAAAERLQQLIAEHGTELIAVGNGTASRETMQFVQKVISDHGLDVVCAVVSEAGASIYSASEAAIEEYPGLDVTVRGAISIGHRLQDPLAELVKLDPATIGAGQYQHDVNQQELRRVLDRETESCVCRVGVDLNTASRPLLARVPGIGPALAGRIAAHRDEHGPFHCRQQLLDVAKLGPIAFEQCSGFLRIRGGDNVLDATAVHPESYAIVQDIAAGVGGSVESLLCDQQQLDALNPEDFISAGRGCETVRDILAELRQPGRDPRAEFRVVRFDDNVSCIEDLTPGMELEGFVTNVTGFGAFVDIGVHHDALLHVSQMADHFVADPTQEVAVGEIVSVRVTEIDVGRKRISLSRRQRG